MQNILANPPNDYLQHHGIQGQKWGRRRYQNSDGSLTEEGRKHYGVGGAREAANKAFGMTKDAFRKAVKPNTSDLREKYKKQQEKNERERIKTDLKKAKIEKKNIKREAKNAAMEEKQRKRDARQAKKDRSRRDITNEEIDQAIERYRKLNTLKALQKDANKSRTRLAMEEAARRAIAKSAGNLLESLGDRLVENFDNKETKARREKDYLENLKSIDKLKNGENSNMDTIKKAKEYSENKKNTVRNTLETRAMLGDEDAIEKLRTFNQVNKGGKNKQESKQESKQEPKQEPKQESKQESKQQSKSESKEKSKQKEGSKVLNDLYKQTAEDVLSDFDIADRASSENTKWWRTKKYSDASRWTK